jgi:hypothetical protein
MRPYARDIAERHPGKAVNIRKMFCKENPVPEADFYYGG